MTSTEPFNESKPLDRQESEGGARKAPAINASNFEGRSVDQQETPWHTLSVEAVQDLTVLPDLSYGVQTKNVPIRRERFGDNIIPTGSGPSLIKIIFNNFVNSITMILAFVAVVSGYFEDWAALGICIFVIVFVGVIGVYQEWNAAASLESLKTMTKGNAVVIRDGKADVIAIDEIVIGDIVVLEQGTNVPVDMRLFECTNLEIDEALLTGEVVPVSKKIDVIDDPKGDCALGDRVNQAFRNTIVVSGRGRGIAVAAGLNTQMGKVAARLAEDGGSTKTPLQLKMEKLMYAIFAVCILLVIIVFASNRFNMTESTIIYGAAVAIAILPQSLVAVVAVSMAISVRKMAAQKCIVRKLGSLEVLDSVTDICSDKTGTLTQNKMVVKSVAIGTDLPPMAVSGAPMEAAATFTEEGNDESDPIMIKKLRREDRRVADFFKAAALCGTTVLTKDEKNHLDGSGNPTEIAIQAMCWKVAAPRHVYEGEDKYQCTGMYSFDSSIKRMSATYKDAKTGEYFLTTKGAPERVLNLCKWKYTAKVKDHLEGDVPTAQLDDLTEEDKVEINATITRFASRGLRTICITRRNNEANLGGGPVNIGEGETIDKYSREDVESDLIFLGIVGIYDPPRVESKLSVNICQRAGIKVRMLTGDHFATATAIAKEIDIVDDVSAQQEGAVMIGPDFDKMSQQAIDLLDNLPSVIGRCSPDTKVNMIEALHRRGRVCAMTGDGFNDSPSIKEADIGCAMGSGTDVTKGVADFIITDDNFATIVKAIAEGRRIALAISKFVTHLLCGNMAETVVLIFGLGIMIDEQSVFVLSPMQILWLNLFTSSPPAIGLSVDAAPDFILRVPPNKKGLFNLELLADTICYGVVLGGTALSSFIYVLYSLGDGPKGTNCNTSDFQNCDDVLRARTTGYVVLYFGMLIHAYNVRYSRVHLFRMRWLDNAWLWGSFIFGISTLLVMIYVPTIAKNVFVHGEIDWEWFVILVALTIFVIFSEVYKLIKNTVDPVPVYDVTPEEAEDERRLFMGEFQKENRAEENDSRTVEEMASSEVQEMMRMQSSFVASM
uniref:Cation-transporting P-type ATPase N-terminal domain-containing protein n=1 Tax=Neobodo designis TaxID=312471 RepID=A0A7S1QL75_NEODS|mmetsp:Transcript_47939/g.147925  ORF Transcript_47939/g.147925 Transcript_47939/m.147925 type:complete len:1059 (+) Transcript_47939:148-3324(+)